MWRRWLPGIGALVVAVLSIGAAAWRQPPELYHETAYLLDTYVQFQVDGPDGAGAVAAAKAVMRRTEGLLNRHDPASDVARLNAGAAPASLDPLTVQALELASAWKSRTGGAFDIGLGRALDLYDFGRGGRVPAVDPVSVLSSDLILDLGGLHKGLAVDLAGAELSRRGIKTGLVDASGNMLSLGNRPDGKPWRIGIAHPRKPGGVIAVVPLAGGQAISTSGDYQQYFERDGVRYHHILDPRTGRPARAGAVSVTVLAPTAAQADILSTALFVLGPEAGLRLAASLPGVEAVFVTDDLTVVHSPGLSGRLEVR